MVIVLARELQGFYEDGEKFMLVSGSELSLTTGFEASAVVKSQMVTKTFLYLS